MKSIVAILSLAVLACTTQGTRSTTTGEQASASASADGVDATRRTGSRSRFEQIREAKTLDEAIAIARPEMGDEVERTSSGALLLTSWAIKGMKWADVAVKSNETTHAAAIQDSSQQRGKRLCVSATLGEMHLARFAQGDVHTGVVRTEAGDLYHYAVVGSTEGLRETGTLCGVVTGKFDYTSRSGSAHTAVQVVGMFDVPGNHRG